jgi:hypothetical protein
MKQLLLQGSLILILAVCFIVGCKKSTETTSLPPSRDIPHDTNFTAPVVPYPVTPVPECNNAPYYGDSIVYAQPSGATDYYISPQTNQGIEGTYLSWPQGLILDPKTGVIDLTRSETGLRYAVGFVKSGTSDTCLSQLIVGGAAYMDSVYVLASSDTTSRPYFDANPYVASPCGNSSGQGTGCQFDYNDYARRQGIIVNKITGYIDLKKTMSRINLSMLRNGQSLITRIYYKLNDQSNNAPQMIELKLVYYVHKSDIPADVLAQVSQNLHHTLTNDLIGTGPTVRPPLIIIVRNN